MTTESQLNYLLGKQFNSKSVFCLIKVQQQHQLVSLRSQLNLHAHKHTHIYTLTEQKPHIIISNILK